MVGKYWEEFKAFAFKGNMIDLAVAVVIGGAFGKIITAIVADLIMPLVAYVTSILHIPKDYQEWHLGNFLVGDLISEIALAIEMGAEAADIALTVHPHPTLSESVGMAAEVYEGTITDLYIPKKKAQ